MNAKTLRTYQVSFEGTYFTGQRTRTFAEKSWQKATDRLPGLMRKWGYSTATVVKLEQLAKLDA